jgi:hypothetical protein
VPWAPPPPSFHEFLDRILVEIPEFRPIADEQLELSDGEYYSTRFFDAFSSAVTERQGRSMEGMATRRDADIVEIWLNLAEDALLDRYVGNAFMETAGDDLMYDVRGRALNDRLGPRLRAALDDRRARHDQASGWPPSGVEFGCDYCADEHNFHYGHVTQIGSSGARRRILIHARAAAPSTRTPPTGRTTSTGSHPSRLDSDSAGRPNAPPTRRTDRPASAQTSTCYGSGRPECGEASEPLFGN